MLLHKLFLVASLLPSSIHAIPLTLQSVQADTLADVSKILGSLQLDVKLVSQDLFDITVPYLEELEGRLSRDLEKNGGNWGAEPSIGLSKQVVDYFNFLKNYNGSLQDIEDLLDPASDYQYDHTSDGPDALKPDSLIGYFPQQNTAESNALNPLKLSNDQEADPLYPKPQIKPLQLPASSEPNEETGFTDIGNSWSPSGLKNKGSTGPDWSLIPGAINSETNENAPKAIQESEEMYGEFLGDPNWRREDDESLTGTSIKGDEEDSMQWNPTSELMDFVKDIYVSDKVAGGGIKGIAGEKNTN
ncbi:hypothetical protein ABW19_dt0202704 [Dactylella cylindrospora]|nr:hypothetical protein ABW19_dt0202704 [Dactylella cylindrospora]